jgi:hypothetical protein
MQGFPQQPQDPMQRLRTLDMQRISQASQNPMQHLETLMKGAPTMGNPGYPGFTQNDSYAVLRSPGNPGFPAFDPNKPQVQPPPGGFFGVPPGYPGNPGFPANSGYPTMQGYPGVPFSGTSGTPGTFASEPMQGYPGMGPMGGQDIRSIAGVAPPNPNGPPMSTEQLKLLASNLGYQTAQGSPGMFGGGPMGMGPMLGGVPSQIGGQDIRNLMVGSLNSRS